MRRRINGRRGVWTVVALLAMVVTGLSSSGSSGATGGGSVSSTGNALATAKQLAAQLTPKTVSYANVLNVMRTLHVRVLTNNGKVLVAGGRGFPAGFYFYNFELRAIVTAMRNPAAKVVSPDDLAASLSKAGLQPNGAPLTADALENALTAGTVRALAHPRDLSGTSALLARALGLQHKPAYDLAHGLSGLKVNFDAMQVALLAIDVAVAAGVQPPMARSTARAADEAPCTGGNSEIAKYTTEAGRFLSWLSPAVKDVLKTRDLVVETISGPILAWGVRVSTTTPTLQSTHYGPAGHAPDAGKPLTFTVTVEETQDFGNVVVDCGPLAGLKLPKKGGIPNVPIIWSEQGLSTPAYGLEQHGTVTYDPANRETDQNGQSSLLFQPKDERDPWVGFGLEKDSRGVVDGIALYQSAFPNVPGGVAQFLFPKIGGSAWDVLYHRPRGLKFTGLKWNAHWQRNDEWEDTTTDLDARDCSVDPTDPAVFQTWQQSKIHSVWSMFVDSPPPGYTLSGEITNGPGEGWLPDLAHELYYDHSIASYAFVSIVWKGTQPFADLALSLDANSSFAPNTTLTTIVGEVPVQEDLTCPPN